VHAFRGRLRIAIMRLMTLCPNQQVRFDGPRLSVSGLARNFGARTIFRGIEFCLVAGDCLVVTGRNGAGKSTLLRTLAGLMRPSRGLISVEAPPLDAVHFSADAGDPGALSERVGLASLEIQFYEELTAAENLAFFGRLRGLAAPREQVITWLDSAGLADRADDLVRTFSSGMKQRLRLLFALQHSPAILLLDEPGSNLDENGRQMVEHAVASHLAYGVLIIATNERDELRFATQVLDLGQ
jgi:heme exporter protein A